METGRRRGRDGKGSKGRRRVAAEDEGGKAAKDEGGKAAQDEGGKAAEDGDGKVQGIRRKRGRRFFRPVPFTIFRQR